MLRGVEDQAAFEAGLNNEVTANGLLKMLRVIADGKAFSQEACNEMLKIMLDQQYRSGIPAGLPKAARVAHKTGNISTVHHDAGIVFLEGPQTVRAGDPHAVRRRTRPRHGRRRRLARHLQHAGRTDV